MRDVLFVSESIKSHLEAEDVFSYCMSLKGKAFRDVPGRKTLQFELAGKSYFIKQHFGVGWAEIFKNLLSFKKPILGALTEVNAIKKLETIGIATTPLVAYGQRGLNPANMQSFVITEDLGDIVSLEDFCADWKEHSPEPDFKRLLIIGIALLAAKLHGAGLCHRDFYLCHFVLKRAEIRQGHLNLYLIDLHRMLNHQAPNSKAVMKDMAALIFSARDSGFNNADWELFKQYYLPQTPQFWMQVQRRADKLYAKFYSQKFQTRLAKEKSAIN